MLNDLLLQQASNSTSEGITISDMNLPDRPLIYLNEGFEKLTGYKRNEVLGTNCRFLQGEETDQNAIDKIRKAIQNGEECTVELLNYRKDGTPFWNRLSLTPLKVNSDKVTHYVGIQSDITEIKNTKERLEAFRKKITRELEQARIAQKFIFPKKLPESSKLKFASRFSPMAEIGGDFFDTIEFENEIYGLLIADVTGHGIPAALLTFMSSAAFKNSAMDNISTSETIRLINKKLFKNMPDSSFVSMFYAIYDSNEKRLTYTQGGHPDGFVIRSKTNEVIRLSTDGMLLGIFSPEITTYEEKSISLSPGDKVLLYTDAIIEVMDSSESMLGIEGIHKFITENGDQPLQILFDRIYEFGLSFSGKTTYDDDFTLVGFEVLS